MKKGFFTSLFLFLGIPFSGFLAPKLYFFFGIKKVMIINGFFFLINCILFLKFENFWLICINSFFSGFIYQLSRTSSSYFLSEKYKNGFFYENFVFMGSNLSNFIWPFIAVYIVNPKNKNMIENNFGENFFPWEISKNFPVLIYSMGFISFFFVVIPIFFFLNDPISIKGHFFVYFKAIFSNNKKKLENLQNEYIEKSEKNSKQSFEKSIFSYSKNFSSYKSETFLESNKILTENEICEKIKKIQKNPKIFFLIFFFSLKLAPLIYFTDNYKLISFQILRSDSLISLALAFSSIFAIFGQILIIQIWKKFDFYKTHIFLSFLYFFNFFIFLKFGKNKFFLITILIFNRFLCKMIYSSINFSKFAIFHPKVAIGISWLIDSCYFFSMVFATSFNFFFFNEGNTEKIFWVFFGVHVFGFCGFLWLFKDFVNDVK